MPAERLHFCSLIHFYSTAIFIYSVLVCLLPLSEYQKIGSYIFDVMIQQQTKIRYTYMYIQGEIFLVLFGGVSGTYIGFYQIGACHSLQDHVFLIVFQQQTKIRYTYMYIQGEIFLVLFGGVSGTYIGFYQIGACHSLQDHVFLIVFQRRGAGKYNSPTYTKSKLITSNKKQFRSIPTCTCIPSFTTFLYSPSNSASPVLILILVVVVAARQDSNRTEHSRKVTEQNTAGQ